MSDLALIGKKIGMTREFYKTGRLVPVTVIKMEKARVINVIEEEKRGYKAVQLGFGKIKNSKLTKAISVIIKFLSPHQHLMLNLVSLKLQQFEVLAL